MGNNNLWINNFFLLFSINLIIFNKGSVSMALSEKLPENLFNQLKPIILDAFTELLYLSKISCFEIFLIEENHLSLKLKRLCIFQRLI